MENESSECKCQMKNEKQKYGKTLRGEGLQPEGKKSRRVSDFSYGKEHPSGALGPPTVEILRVSRKCRARLSDSKQKCNWAPGFLFFVPPSPLSLLTPLCNHLIVFLIFLAQHEEVAADLASNLQEKDNC